MLLISLDLRFSQSIVPSSSHEGCQNGMAESENDDVKIVSSSLSRPSLSLSLSHPFCSLRFFGEAGVLSEFEV